MAEPAACTSSSASWPPQPGSRRRRPTGLPACGYSQNVLAKMVIDRVPSVEMVRFVNSGTEACLSVVRLMRAYTGREKVGAPADGHGLPCGLSGRRCAAQSDASSRHGADLRSTGRACRSSSSPAATTAMRTSSWSRPGLAS